MELIDTHAHLYAEEFDNDRMAMLQRARAAGLSKIILPNIDSGSIAGMLELADAAPDLCFATMGLHPCSVKPESWENELEICRQWLQKRAFHAIGECGMDLYWDTTTQNIQAQALDVQCQWAVQYDLPILIHSRNATRECIDILRPYTEKGLRGVFHCFSGTLEEAKEITAMGMYLGVGGVVTFKKSGLGEILQQVDPQFLLLETDAPYLAPVPFRGKRNESAFLSYITDTLGDYLLKGRKDLAQLTSTNALTLFKTI